MRDVIALRAYRRLLRAANRAEGYLCCSAESSQLVSYIRHRFRACIDAQRGLFGNAAATRRRRMLQKADQACEALSQVSTNETIKTAVAALALGVGSHAYRQHLARGMVDAVAHQERAESRGEAEDRGVSERLNRVLQNALQPYAATLRILHANLEDGSLARALTPRKAGVAVHTLSHGDDRVVVEVDDTLNRQTVYVRTQNFLCDEPTERVEMAECEELRGTMVHAAWFSVARRLTASLVEEAPLHRSRRTTVVGHGLGGAVALGVGMLLLANGFPIRNVVTFGAPKLLSCTLERVVFQLSPIRVVIAGDPLVALPTSTFEGDPFRHCGESLVLGDGRPIVDGRGRPPNDVYAAFSMERYALAMESPQASLMYAEGNEIWDDGDRCSPDHSASSPFVEDEPAEGPASKDAEETVSKGEGGNPREAEADSTPEESPFLSCCK